MEFPELGEHCSNENCKQLDFLPMKCDACYKIFCKNHVQYSTHNCPESYKKDNQVPVCPLCNSPVPLQKGESADVKVGHHIDNDCQSDPAVKRRKVYTNRCNKKGCKQKELVPVTCDGCHLNYCLRHRHEEDHSCQGFQGTGMHISKPGAYAFLRSKSNQNPASKVHNKPQQTKLTDFGGDLDRARQARAAERRQQVASHTRGLQGGMTEDEAVAQALALSLADSGPGQGQSNVVLSKDESLTVMTQQEEEDMQLAKALAESESMMPKPQQQSEGKEKRNCHLS